MGAACSRIRDRRKKKSVDERGFGNKDPHPPWPSPINGPQSTLDPILMPPKQFEAMEKGRHEPPPTMAHRVPATGIAFSSEVNDHGLEDVGSQGEDASADDKDERNKDEKRRLSRILSGRASTVRNMTTIVAKKGASRVRILLLLFDSVVRSSKLFNHKQSSCRITALEPNNAW